MYRRIVLPGLDPMGGDLEWVPRVVGELIQIRTAIDLIIAYSDALMIGEAYRASISYPLSWKNVDLRLGIGNSPISAS